jgi:hypothetical protein
MRQRQNISKYTCIGVMVAATTASADILLCYHLVRPAKCGTECPPEYPVCISVTCDTKQECSLLALEQLGTWGCPTKGCYCNATQLTPVMIPNPNPEQGPTPGCSLPSTPTVAPDGCGGSDITGTLGTGTCTN